MIIGLSGTNGAGKDTVGALLAEKHRYFFVSVTELLRDECRKRGLPVERQHLSSISAEWRRQFGLAVLVDRAMDAFAAAGGEQKYAGIVMSSLRHPQEADRVRELGGVVVWVDADPKVRYDRIQANAHHRGRGGEDNKTFEQFLIEQEAEMHQTGDEATLNMAAVKERADVTITNDSADMQTLDQLLSNALSLGS